MSESIWGYFFLLLGVIAAALLILFSNINIKNEQNYYLLKEVTQNAMLDAVDDIAYEVGLTQKEVDKINTIKCPSGKPGTIRIITERFVESFARRYAELADLNKTYKIEFYEILECPAKVSVKVSTKEDLSWIGRLLRGSGGLDDAVIQNQLTSILETKD